MFVHKLVLSSHPVLSENDQLTSLAYMKNHPGFKGVIPPAEGTAYTLWETEENANAFNPYNGLVVSLIVSTEIMPLDQSGKVEADFFRFGPK